MPKRKVHFLPRVNLRLASEYAAQRGQSEALPARSPTLDKRDASEVQNEAACLGAGLSKPRTDRSSRPDVPILRDHVRATAEGALATAANPQAYAAALVELDRDMYAATSTGPREAVWATYQKFHASAVGGNVPVLPLSTEAVRKVAALFKAAGYRSYRNYIGRAKDEHLSRGHDISPQLERMIRLCRRSVIRGLAGPVRSEPFSFEDVCEALKDRVQPIVQAGPIFPLALVVTAVFFLLRELEAAAASWQDVVFAEDRFTVTLTLPSSKTDWSAKGCRRTWGCLCSRGKPCVYHTLLRYRAIAKERGLIPGPLFVDEAGRGCTKGAVVETLRAAVALTGAAILDPVGRHMFSGHAFRITGARAMSLWGLDAITIQLLGRWGSLAILSYIAEAPLTDLAQRLHRDGLSSLPQQVRTAEHPEFRELTGYTVMLQEALQRIAQLETDLKTFHDALSNKAGRASIEILTDRVDHAETVLDGVAVSLESATGPQPWFVLNEDSRALHRALIDIKSTTTSWTTLCGWPFAGLKHVATHVGIEPKARFRKCHKCYPDVDSESSDDGGSGKT